MNIEKKVFDLGDVVSILTTENFSQRRLKGMADMMRFMCSHTAVAPTFDNCSKSLLIQFPQFGSDEFILSMFDLIEILSETEDEELRWQFKNDWLQKQRDIYGDEFEVKSFPRME
jgi:hypothetical protein